MRAFSDATVVFDLDGTLVDTAPDLAAAANTVLREIGRPELTVGELRPYVGKGARETLRHGIAVSGGGVEEDGLTDLLERFLAVYMSRIAQDSRPYPHVIEAMDALGAGGAVLAVCTNKREDPARLLLQQLGLLDRFAAVVGGDTCPTRKPDPESLGETLRRCGGRARAVMIGDTAADVGAARGLGIPIVAVSFGYSPLPAAQLGADAVIDSYKALVPTLNTVLESA
ncbi:MAG: HAD-IA family hydrolase [Alphaproteobacteria bacterium]